MRAVDVSNYSDEITADTLAAWRAADVGLVIIQAFPPSYAQYAEQRRQMQACQDAGMPFDVYVYDYLASPDWRDGALYGLDAAKAAGHVPGRVWLDEEDVSPSAQRLTAAEGVAAIQASVTAAQARGWDVGIYTGAWWWGPYTSNSTAFTALPLWLAQYDGVEDAAAITPVGGWTTAAVKQYAGTSSLRGVGGVDLNVLSAGEAARVNPPTPVPAPPADDVDTLRRRVADLESALGYATVDLAGRARALHDELDRLHGQFLAA